MQYDRQPDGTDKPLKQTGVDTGMGLERLCAVIQDKDSVFDIDLFAPIIARIERLTGIVYSGAKPEIQAAFRVLSDHIRSSCFAIADGATPSNEGRGYVIRKIIRRAALFAQKLHKENIFPKIAPAFIDYMSPIYPELKAQESQIIALLKSEVEKFEKTFIHGQSMLEKYFQETSGKVVSGAQAFKLYDTYGFPLELTKVIAHERGFTVDVEGFEKHMEQQKAQSGKKVAHADIALDESVETAFTGYDEHQNEAKILQLFVDNKPVQSVTAGTEAIIITNRSPFFVECGGQVSDQGFIRKGEHEAQLLGLRKIGSAIGATIVAPVALTVGDTVTQVVDSPARINTMKNHTATHLLQAALIELLGKQVRQSGSVVTPDYLRFDFTYHENLTPEQITLVENLVNKKILENIPVHVSQGTLKEASARGVIAIFGEKYNPEKVRIVEVPGFSAELCGGTHVHATGDIGSFKITEVSALSAGNRRIVAVTGPASVELFQQSFNTIKALGQEFKVPGEQVADAIKKQKEQLKQAQGALKDLKKQLYLLQMPHWLSSIENYGSIPFLFLSIDNATAEELREISQEFLKAQPGLYFLVGQGHERATYFVTLAQNLAQQFDLKAFGAWLKDQGLQGGGSGTTLQGGTTRIDLELEHRIKKWLHEHAARI
jgi:alanyl-tRNA synthetase